jgi:hypothetical protein
MPEAVAHPNRKELARFLLSRAAEPEAERAPALAGTPRLGAIPFPESVPAAAPLPQDPDPGASLPAADVVVMTWTADEARALAHVFTPQRGLARWYSYDRNFESNYLSSIRAGAPARTMRRLARYMPATVGEHSVLCIKSELHLNQDGIEDRDAQGRGLGTATLPVKDFFKQVMAETGARYFLTIGTAGSVFEEFGLGDVVITRAARFRCTQEFRNEPFNGAVYTSDWPVPTTHVDAAEQLMATVTANLAQPPVGAPSPAYPDDGELAEPTVSATRIRRDGDGTLPEFWPILTTDYFEYGTTSNRLDQAGAGVEMGDAALGLAVQELPEGQRPRWLVVRNMSDPVINGRLPAREFHLNEQTTWAVGFYTAYGYYTSINGAIATWAVIAGLEQE